MTQVRTIAAIPGYNEERYIGDIVRRAGEYVDQVIVVDDGSCDGTAGAARAAGALVISHSTNRGYGGAIKSCFEAAKANAADVIVILDGDGQHNPNEICQLLAPILNGEADLVIGSRFLQPDKVGADRKSGSEFLARDSRLPAMPRYRKFGISVITFLFNFGSKTKVSDAQSGFRAYSKKVFETFPLSEKGMSISVETLEKARRKGAAIKEVPISCTYTPSTLNPRAIRMGLGLAINTVRFRLSSILSRILGRRRK